MSDVSVHDDLIIDVGMHDGGDAAFYLAKGFRVVAIEANPLLVAQAEVRFAEELASGRLRLINAAVADECGTTQLAVSDESTIWSSLSPEFVRRNETQVGTKYRYVDVRAVTFEEVLADVGIPYYLKVDIEGFDMLCVRALHRFRARPAYVSVESNVSVNHAPFDLVFDELAELWSLGYRSFKYVNQQQNPNVVLPQPPLEGRYAPSRFTHNDSGPFGRETPGPWRSIGPTMGRSQSLRLIQNAGGLGGRWSSTLPSMAYRAVRHRLLKKPTGWYDLHASMG